MMIPQPLTVIDIAQSTADVTSYNNFPLSLINNHVVRVGIMTEDFYWHYHPNSDECFMTVEGILLIDLESSTVELAPGQLFTVPANTPHRTRPKAGRSVNITFELGDMQTVRI